MVGNASTPVESVDAPSTQGLNKLGLELAETLNQAAGSNGTVVRILVLLKATGSHTSSLFPFFPTES